MGSYNNMEIFNIVLFGFIYRVLNIHWMENTFLWRCTWYIKMQTVRENMVFWDSSLKSLKNHKVFVKPIGITNNTMRYFQNLKNSKDDPLGGNHRPIQPLNGREVTFSRSVKINGEWESWDYGNHWGGEKSNGKFWLINV